MTEKWASFNCTIGFPIENFSGGSSLTFGILNALVLMFLGQ